MIRDRVHAYRACFRVVTSQPRPWWAFWRKEDELSPVGAAVLRDLARICYANKTTASTDPVAMGVAEGRRQVLLHIQQMLRLTDAEVHRLSNPEGVTYD